jgi:hypothetical protein
MSAANPSEFDARFDAFSRSVFRLETLDHYAVNRDMLARYLTGDPLPPDDKSIEWLAFVREATAAGKTVGRARVAPTRLTPYVRYEIEWGYLYNAVAGETVALVITDDAPALFAGLPLEDFWLIDNDAVGRMTYDQDGAFTGATLVTEPTEVRRYVACRDRALQHATPLREFLRRERNA